MTEDRLDPLADAVLDAWETGAQVDYGTAQGDARARRELAMLERSAALAAAAIAASCGQREPMPPAFAARMLAIGQQIAAAQPGGATPGAPASPLVGRPIARSSPFGPLLLGLGLGLAAGLPLGKAVFCTDAPADPFAQRDQLVASAPVRKVTFQPGPAAGFGTVRGDVVWSDARQEGYLQLDGLAALPPEQQYQLWIVDVRRVGAPVDGGVFDLGNGGPQVVPIEAKLKVAEAKAFVVTVEPRGGVVVSDQKNVVAIASL